MKIDLKNNKKLSISLIIVLMILSIIGGTFAFFSWEVNESQKTIISLGTGSGSYEIVGGNVEKTGMYPTANCSGEAALISDVATVTAVNGSDSIDMEASLKIRASLSVNQGIMTNAKKSKINWAIVDVTTGFVTVDACRNTPYKGTFSGVTTNTDIDTGISFVVSPGATVINKYRIYVWLDMTYEHKNLGNDITDPMQNLFISVRFSPNSQLVQLGGMPNPPVLDDGMIPIKISSDGVVTTVASDDETWYNYSNKEWANAVLVKESGINSRDYYKSNVGVEVLENDILAYFVWIPRYRYKIWTLTESSAGMEQSIDIVFETTDTPAIYGTTVGSYRTHPAFIWDEDLVSGIWVGKFETAHSTLTIGQTENNLACTDENCFNADGLIVKPNATSFAYSNISNLFYASRSMTRSGNSFGLSSSQTDMHMMKNSEWAAVAYLSHSRYGINSEIYINNSTKTGRSAGDVDISQSYYTWTGQEIISGVIGDYASNRTLGTNASTTGNVTGVYDMSGGNIEYVMGNYNNSIMSSGFQTMPDSKYYDKYTTTAILTACNGSVCLGHALSEVASWYSNLQSFFYAVGPWLARGGKYNSNDAGIWYYAAEAGASQIFPYSQPYGFRVAAVVLE